MIIIIIINIKIRKKNYFKSKSFVIIFSSMKFLICGKKNLNL